MGLVRPRTLRPVAGVCASVDSRPLPPRRAAFGLPVGLTALRAVGLTALRAADARFLAGAAPDRPFCAADRLFGADDLFRDAGLFRLPGFALRAAFFAIGVLLDRTTVTVG
jgi:hypothetical protein